MTDLTKLTIAQARDALKNKEFTCQDLVKHYLSNIEKYKDKNAVLEVFDDAIIHQRQCFCPLVISLIFVYLNTLTLVLFDNLHYTYISVYLSQQKTFYIMEG